MNGGLRRFSPVAYVILTPTLPEPVLGMVQLMRELSALTPLHLPPEAACNRTAICQSIQRTALSSSTGTLLHTGSSDPPARRVTSEKSRDFFC
jgi:hypothetical protein